MPTPSDSGSTVNVKDCWPVVWICENEAGYSGSEQEIYTRRKECLVNKCNTSFGSDSQAKQGCLFLANFMEAAGNPNHNYREVECPKVLTDKY